MLAGLDSDGLGSEDFGSEGLLGAASDFLPALLASPGFALRLVARAGGPASTDRR